MHPVSCSVLRTCKYLVSDNLVFGMKNVTVSVNINAEALLNVLFQCLIMSNIVVWRNLLWRSRSQQWFSSTVCLIISEMLNSLPSNLVCWGIINDYYHIENGVFVLLSVIKVKVTCFNFMTVQTVLYLNYLPQTWHTGTSKPHKHGLLSRLWTRSQGSNSHRMFVNRFLLIYKTFCSKTYNAGTH